MRDGSNDSAACKLAYVVRTVGERTESLCIDLIKRYRRGVEETLSVIREPTHVDAIEKTLATAAEQSIDWVVAVDADMLLYPDALNRIRRELVSLYESAGVVHFAVADKLYRMKRWGVTVYRRDIAAEGLLILRSMKGKRDLKIERAMIKRLEERGRIVTFSRTDVALHDFFQYYKDLYRKAYLNAIRNPSITQRAKGVWRKMASLDPDYTVMLRGMYDAAGENRELSNSVEDFDPVLLAQLVETLGLEEKEALVPERYATWNMDAVIGSQISSIQKNKVAKDYFEPGNLDRIRKSAERRLRSARIFPGLGKI